MLIRGWIGGLFVLILASLVGAPAAFAEGGISSGGGDAYAAEFVHIGKEVLNMLQRVPVRGVSRDRFRAVLNGTRVYSQEIVRLDGRELDAVNTPAEHRVVLSRSRWRALRDLPRNKLVLVAHEYFSLMGLDDKNYAYSNAIFSRPGIPTISYTCNLFDDFGPLAKYRLQFLIYKDFYAALIVDDRGMPTDDLGITPVYTYTIHGNPKNLDTLTGEWVVTAPLYFTTRILSLDYSDKVRSGNFRTLDVSSLNPIATKKSSTACKVVRN
ncbi:MAG: hypothetical protein JST04_17265 [Bdellovibrionales bacterium]|nr:hypothetical protein [Bdellovibrionales bacterium]